jgi:hypothetical protein
MYMRKLVFTLCCLVIVVFAKAQTAGMSINTTGAAANSSAMLDVASTAAPYKGMLIPRVSTTNMNLITVSASTAGLMIYNSTVGAFYFYNGTSWVPIGVTNGTAAGQIAITGSSPFVPQTPQTVTGDVTINSSGVTAIASLPAISGANLTALNGSNIASGTVPAARLGTSSGSATTFLNGSGAFTTPTGTNSYIMGGFSTPGNAQPNYSSVIGTNTNVALAAVQMPMPVACTIDAIYISGVTSSTAANANSYTGTLLVNGVATTLIVSFANSNTAGAPITSIVNTTNSVSVSVGDMVTMRWDPNSNTGATARINYGIHAH